MQFTESTLSLLTIDTKYSNIVSPLDTKAMSSRLDILHGTLDLLILRTLRGDPMHGWAVSERIQQISQEVLQVNQGSLYPALHRLEHQGFISSSWAISELGRRARFYQLTAAGRRRLEQESDEWSRISAAIGRVLRFA